MRARLAASLAGLAALAAATLTSGCGNAGEGRVLTIEATGHVTGLVYLDRNGNRQPDGGNVDTGLVGVGVRLVVQGGRDTVARATTDAAGVFQMTGVPVGHYAVVVDTATVGDSVAVVRIDTSAISLTRADSADTVRIAISYPIVSIAQARQLPVGTRAFIEGVSLTVELCAITACSYTFGDSTLHLADSSGAIRATRVKSSFPTSVTTGDSVRLLGARSNRAGQPTWDNVTVIHLFQNFPIPPPAPITNASARTANGGVLDAALVRVLADTIVDTTTVLVGPDSNRVLLTTFDGTDTLLVLVDSTVAAKKATISRRLSPDSTRAFTGILVPTGAGTWRLKPRSDSDILP